MISNARWTRLVASASTLSNYKNRSKARVDRPRANSISDRLQATDNLCLWSSLHHRSRGHHGTAVSSHRSGMRRKSIAGSWKCRFRKIRRKRNERRQSSWLMNNDKTKIWRRLWPRRIISSWVAGAAQATLPANTIKTESTSTTSILQSNSSLLPHNNSLPHPVTTPNPRLNLPSSKSTAAYSSFRSNRTKPKNSGKSKISLPTNNVKTKTWPRSLPKTLNLNWPAVKPQTSPIVRAPNQTTKGSKRSNDTKRSYASRWINRKLSKTKQSRELGERLNLRSSVCSRKEIWLRAGSGKI